MPRPPGLPKTGGRRAGVANRATREFRELVCDDTRDFLLLRLVAAGRPVNNQEPSLDQIIKASGLLLDRAMPRLKFKESVSVEYRSLREIPTGELMDSLGIEQVIVEG
jgi:hypothetical protein